MSTLIWNDESIELVRFGIFQSLICYTRIWKNQTFHVLTSELEQQNADQIREAGRSLGEWDRTPKISTIDDEDHGSRYRYRLENGR